MYGFIYMTTNLINGKKYIGQHKGDGTDSYLGSGDRLIMAIKKYGKHNFKREILCFAKSKEELDLLEIWYINEHNAVEDDNYYNIANGGCVNPHYGKDNGMYGRNHTEEARFKMSKAWEERDKTIYQTESFKTKISEVTKGEHNGMFGKSHTEESKRKMSENSVGKTKGELNGNFGNKGEKAKNGKPVYKYADKDKTILVKKYNTVRLVLEELEVKGHVSLYNAMRDGVKYKGYYWSR